MNPWPQSSQESCQIVINVDALVFYESKFLLHVSFIQRVLPGWTFVWNFTVICAQRFVTINDGGVWVCICCMWCVKGREGAGKKSGREKDTHTHIHNMNVSSP